MKIAICDDETYIREAVKRLLEEEEKTFVQRISAQKSYTKAYEQESCDVFMFTPEELWKALKEDFEYDVMILDIELHYNDMTGIDMAKKINQQAPLCRIIYLTNFIEYAQDVYETKHCYFVLKKDMDVKLPLALEKAWKSRTGDKAYKMLEFAYKGRKTCINSESILYIERYNRATKIITANQTYTIYDSLIQLQHKLKGNFVRVHGGFIVNLAKTACLRNDEIVMENQSVVPIGRNYKMAAKKAYMEYWADRT